MSDEVFNSGEFKADLKSLVNVFGLNAVLLKFAEIFFNARLNFGQKGVRNSVTCML